MKKSDKNKIFFNANPNSILIFIITFENNCILFRKSNKISSEKLINGSLILKKQ